MCWFCGNFCIYTLHMHDVQRAPSARCPSRGPCDEVVFKLIQRHSCHLRYTTSRHGGRSSRRRGPRGAVQTRRWGRGVLGIQGCHHKQGHHRGEIFPSRFFAQQNKEQETHVFLSIPMIMVQVCMSSHTRRSFSFAIHGMYPVPSLLRKATCFFLQLPLLSTATLVA